MFTGPMERQRIDANVAESGVCAASEPAAESARRTRSCMFIFGGRSGREERPLSNNVRKGSRVGSAKPFAPPSHVSSRPRMLERCHRAAQCLNRDVGSVARAYELVRSNDGTEDPFLESHCGMARVRQNDEGVIVIGIPTRDGIAEGCRTAMSEKAVPTALSDFDAESPGAPI